MVFQSTIICEVLVESAKIALEEHPTSGILRVLDSCTKY